MARQEEPFLIRPVGDGTGSATEWHLPSEGDTKLMRCGLHVSLSDREEHVITTSAPKCQACVRRAGPDYLASGTLEVVEYERANQVLLPNCKCLTEYRQAWVEGQQDILSGRVPQSYYWLAESIKVLLTTHGSVVECKRCGAKRFIVLVLPPEYDPNFCN
jgi:hypothetical protein